MEIKVLSYHYDSEGLFRPHRVFESLSAMDGVKVEAVVASFDHIQKKQKSEPMEGVRIVDVPAYRKNISWARIQSYREFANAIHKQQLLKGADIVYAAVPDYLSSMVAVEEQKKYGYKTIVDVVDLWPEALPLPSAVNKPAKKVLRSLLHKKRQKIFSQADRLLFQSQHFLESFGAPTEKCSVLPMCSNAEHSVDPYMNRPSIEEKIHFLYLGSLNHITDVQSLCKMLKIIGEQRKVVLEVVGGGAGLDDLKQRTSSLPVETIFHGITFDEGIKQQAFECSHFGFNGYVETTEVSVSYKSMEYLRNRIPLINCTKGGDLTRIINEHEAGFNYTPAKVDELAASLLKLNQNNYDAISDSAAQAYDHYFSFSAFKANIQKQVADLTR